MKAIILAAGYGNGLHGLTKDTHQALLPIRGRPMIEHLVEKIQISESIDEIFILTNHRFFENFKSWLQDYVYQVPVKLIDNNINNQRDARGATRDLAFAIESANIDDDILVVGADNLFSSNLLDFLKQAFLNKPHPSIGIYNINGKARLKRYGLVSFDESCKIKNFEEKPSKLNGTRFVSMCLYFIPKEKISTIKDFLSQTNDGVFIGSYIEWLCARENVYVFDCKGNWLDVGDEESYTEAICNF